MNGIGIAAEFGDDERHALRHQAGNERDIARQPVELGDQDAAFAPALAAARAAASCGRRSSASAPLPVSASTNSAMMVRRLGFGEAGDGRALRFDPEARALLLLCGDTIVGNSAFPYKRHTTVCPLYN